MKLKTRILHWLPVLIIVSGIFYASSASDAGPAKVLFEIPYFDKIAHFIEYFILSFFLFRAFTRSENFPFLKAIYFAVIFSAFYGAADEVHQRFVPERTCDIFDWFADLTGSIAPHVVLFVKSIKHRS